MAQNVGHIVQIIGPVLDVKFGADHMPAVYNAIEIKRQDGSTLVAEVAQHLGDDVVRCIAMSATEGLVRGMEAVDTGAAISVPVGTETLGRIFNVTGNAVDGKPEPQLQNGQSTEKLQHLKNNQHQLKSLRQGLK